MTEPTAPPAAPPPPPPAVAWEAPPNEPGPAPGVEFAPHGARLLSYILDAVIVTIAMVVFLAIVGAVVAGSASSGASGVVAGGVAVLVIGVIVISIGYWPWFWMRGGQTPGMKPFGLYVVDDRTGGPISGGAAMLRLLGYFINGIALYIGYAWVLIDKRRRGWHDLIAGTVVVKRT